MPCRAWGRAGAGSAELERQGPIRAWIVDETGFPKRGKHSVGVARQYYGQLGKQDNCQVAVGLSVATDQASLPIAYQLYLPEGWANEPDRRAKQVCRRVSCSAPDPKSRSRRSGRRWRPASRRAWCWPMPDDIALRAGLTEMGLTYVVGVQCSIRLWLPDMQPLPPQRGAAAVAALARPAPARIRAGFCQGTGRKPCLRTLAPHHLARGRQGAARLALCRRPRPSGPPRLLARSTTT
ncbi:transposase [Mesorhizobium sp. M0115]